MKHTVQIISFLFLILLQTNSQDNNMILEDLGKELINTENAFAETTKNSTVRSGFSKFIAKDGILFRPGPVNGLEFLEHSSDQPGILLWYPTSSIISKSGDLGVNTGPWEFKKTSEDESIAFGQFLTVWEKQDSGKWEFLIDLGISHQRPETIEDTVETASWVEDKDNHGDYNDILEIEKFFDMKSSNENYRSLTNNETIIFRNNRLPIKNEEIDIFIENLSGTIKLETLGGKSSSANDLAYTYGKGSALDDNKNIVYQFYYLHVYVNKNDGWKLRFDVVIEIPTQE